jgi:hypothetical protein
LLFRRNLETDQASLEAGYPHPAGTVRLVRPKADDPDTYYRSGRLFAHYLEEHVLSDDDNSYREFRNCFGLNVSSKVSAQGACMDSAPSGKRQRVNAAGSATSRQPSLPEPPARENYGSIMEAYEAAAPGDVIKLLAGRHTISTFRKDREKGLDNVLAKSVQIVADDGLPRDRVIVNIAGGLFDTRMIMDASAIAVVNADVRIAGLTLVCSKTEEQSGYICVRDGGRLWLEGCEMRKISSRDGISLPYASPMEAKFARGVSVGTGSSCFICRCVIDGAGGAGI